jgi:hypothetical protein
MPWNISDFDLSEFIVHEVPKPSGGQPILSDIGQPIPLEIKNYFCERINDTLQKGGIDVVADPDTESPVPEQIFNTISDPATFVGGSRIMASHLYEQQTARNPGGLLTVITGTLRESPCLYVLKVEKEEGVRIAQDNVDGHIRFSIEHLRELMLTQKTRLFKAGAITLPGDEWSTLTGTVSDSQQGAGSNRNVAQFFLRFLGFKYAEQPTVLTERIYHITTEFINDSDDSAETKARYQVALVSELQSQDDVFVPLTFATKHLDLPRRQQYMNRIQAANLPGGQIPKDISQIERKLAKIAMTFDSGVSVIASSDQLGDGKPVRLSTDDDGLDRIEIIGRLKEVKSRA